MGALNAAIPLAINPPQQGPNAMQQYYGVQAEINKQKLEQQAQQQNELAMQQGQLQLQMQQQQFQDQQTIRGLAKDFVGKDANGNATFDFKGMLDKAVGSGVSPLTVQALRTQYAESVSKMAAADETVRNGEMAKNKAAYEVLEGIKGLDDPEGRQKAYQVGLNRLAMMGVNVGQFPVRVPDDQTLEQFEAGLGMHGQLLADAKIQQEMNKSVAEQAKAEAETKEKQTEQQIKELQLKAYQGGGGTSLIPGIPLDIQEANAWLKAHPGKTPADYMKYKATLVPAFNFNLQATGGPQGASTPQQQATAQAILDGRMSPPGSFALKTPYWQAVMGEVFRQDPQWNEQRAQLRKDFTVGKHSTEINAINTAMGHVGVLGDAIDALNNGNIKVLNGLANQLGVQVGKDNVTTFNTIVHRVGPEIAKAYISAGGTAGERGADEKDFDPSLGPKQLKSNVSMTAKLLRSKISSLENQWNQNRSEGMPSFEDRFIMPEAKTQLDKWAPQKGGGATGAVERPVRDKNGNLLGYTIDGKTFSRMP